MKFSIADVFCEVISGLALTGTLLPVLILLGVLDDSSIFAFLGEMSGADYIPTFVLLYILGVVFDAIGLPADHLLKKIGIDGHTPEPKSTKAFLKNASSDLYQYRWNAWVHYYCFRNVLILLPFFAFFWAAYLVSRNCWVYAGLFVVISCLFIVMLYYSVKQHADFIKR